MALGFTSILTVIMSLMLTVLKRRIRSVLCDFIVFLRIGSCLACIYRVMDAHRKFGERERSMRVLAS